MATLRTTRKLAAVSRDTPENTRHSQSRYTLDPGMVQDYVSQVSEKIEGRVTKELSKDFNERESQISGALFKLDDFVQNPHVQTCSVAVPQTSRQNDSENRQTTGDRFLADSCPEMVFSAYHSSNLNDWEQEESHHMVTRDQEVLPFCFTGASSGKQNKACSTSQPKTSQ